MKDLPADVGFELVKLMMQVAFSDHELSSEEEGYLRGLGQQLDLDEPQTLAIGTWLDGSQALPPPNLGMLKAHGEVVMRVAAGLMVADGVVAEGERDMIQQLATLLT